LLNHHRFIQHSVDDGKIGGTQEDQEDQNHRSYLGDPKSGTSNVIEHRKRRIAQGLRPDITKECSKQTDTHK